MKTQTQAQQLKVWLALDHDPAMISFRDAAPSGVRHIPASGPASCSYWKMASEGEIFYTEAADHQNCPIGAYTHGAELSAEKSKELGDLVQMMVDLQYLKKEEVPDIPHRPSPLRFVVYAPLAQAPCEPDVVMVRGNAKQIMLLAEAARAAGVGGAGDLMGRPTCAMLPRAQQTAQAVASLGCIGNRVYTEVAEDEMYAALPGSQLDRILGRLDTIVKANQALEQFHQERKERLSPKRN